MIYPTWVFHWSFSPEKNIYFLCLTAFPVSWQQEMSESSQPSIPRPEDAALLLLPVPAPTEQLSAQLFPAQLKDILWQLVSNLLLCLRAALSIPEQQEEREWSSDCCEKKLRIYLAVRKSTRNTYLPQYLCLAAANSRCPGRSISCIMFFPHSAFTPSDKFISRIP